MINFIDENGKQHSAIVECKKTKGVNGEKSLTGTIYTNDEILEGIGRGWRLQFEDENYFLTYANPIDEGTRIVVEFDAVHEFFFDMSKSVVYAELNGSNTAGAYLDFIFKGSGYDYHLEVTIPAFEKESFGMKNRLDLFKDFVSSTGVEFSVNGKIVRILEKVGSNLSTIVKKGFNLNELRIEKNIGNFITYLKGYGAYNDPEDQTKGRLEVEYLSPLSSIYGKLEGNPIVDERYKNATSLTTRLKNDIESSYGISVDIDMEDLTKAGYEYDQPHEGDYIMAINKDLGFEQKIRIMSYTTSYDTEGNVIDHDVSCGSDNLVSQVTKSDNDFRKNVQAGLENAVNTANQAWISADGKSKVFTGTDEPVATNKGDIWYQVDGEKTIMKFWNGYEWQEFIDPKAVQQAAQNAEAVGNAAQAAANEAKQVADEAKTAGQNAEATANQASTNAQTALDNANNAVDKASQASQKADNSATMASDAKNQAATAVSNANTALANANKAISDAGTLSEDISELDTIANQAKSDAGTALINANKGITDAKTALDKATGVDTRVTTEIATVNNTLASKANIATVDALSSTVSSQGTAISQNATDIKLKADSTVVNAIKGTVDSQGSLIEQNASNIKLKANQSSVDTLTGRVSANETAIDVTAQGVNTLVTKTDNTNTALSQFKQEYDGFKADVYTKSQTDTKVSTVQQSVDQFKTTVSNTYSTKTETQAVKNSVDSLGTNIAYAWSEDGKDRFTRTFSENLAKGQSKVNGFGAFDSQYFLKKGNVSGSNWTTSSTYMPSYTTTKAWSAYCIKKESMEGMSNGDTFYFSAFVWNNGDSNITMDFYSEGVTGKGTSFAVPPKQWYRLEIVSTINDFDSIDGLRFESSVNVPNGLYVTDIVLKKDDKDKVVRLPSDVDYDNAIPRYIGRSLKDSNNPADYKWEPYSGFAEGKTEINETAIDQTNKAIILKADQTTVNEVSGRVTTAEGNITTMAGQVALKANQSDVDTVKGRVSATEASLTLQDGKITTLTSKTDGNTTSIGNLQSSYSGLSSTIATVQNTLDNLNSVNLLKGTLTFDSKYFVDKGSVQTSNWATGSEYNTTVVTTSSAWSAKSYLWSALKDSVAENTDYTVSILVFIDGQNSTSVGIYGPGINQTKNVTAKSWQKVSFVVRFDKSINDNLRFEPQTDAQIYWAEMQLEKGNEATLFKPNKADLATVTQFSSLSQTVSSIQGIVANKAEQSQFTQLADRMNFRVTNSDGSITQIDLANKVISLSGEQVNITGNTYIANGVIKTAAIADLAVSTAKIADLAVTDAKISSLTANKITAGTIDANVITVKNISASNITGGTMTADRINGGTINGGNVNIINLNASNITSGTISGTNLSIDLANGVVNFQKGVIQKTDGKFLIDVTNGVIESYQSSGGFTLNSGKIELRDSSMFNANSGIYGKIGWDLGFFAVTGLCLEGKDGWQLTKTGSKHDIIQRSIGSGIYGNTGLAIFAQDTVSIRGGSLGDGGFQPQILVGCNRDSISQVGPDINIYGKYLRIGSEKGTSINGNLSVISGNLSVTGSKNAIHQVGNDWIATPAYETAESYLGDIGSNQTNESGEVTINVEYLFSRIVNTNMEYQVFVSSYGEGHVWVEQRYPLFFVVKSSKPNTPFAFEIKAKRKGYEFDRLVKQAS